MKVLVSVLLITAAVPWLMAGRLDAQDTGDVALSVAGDRCSGMIVAQRDKEFTVALDSNATTGYCWELSAPLDGAIVRLVKTEYRPGASERPGATGKEVWTFMASGVGETEIAMKYVRPWEREATPARTALFKVTINP